MPELPEVETIRRQLAPLVEGETLTALEVLDPRWCRPLPAEDLAALSGRTVEGLGRRGKYLVWGLEDDVHLLMHLRMTGAILADPPHRPAHARVRLQAGAHELWFVDPRRFGTGELALGTPALDAFFAERLGLEPLDPAFSARHLRALARGRRAPVKAFLLDQRRIAGVGNIYADEALYRARIHPLRAAGRLTGAEWERVRAGVVEALLAGIEARGASIDDFRHIDGVRGSFQDRFLVHRRAGAPCGRCGTEIVKLVAAGRGTYVCRTCQPPPRRRAGAGGGR
jgi:formamidopyrimidine-DNA glycosylase